MALETKPSWALHPANREYPVYSKEELDEFEQWLDTFAEDKIFKNPKTGEEKKMRPIRIWDAMEAFGSVKKSVVGDAVSCAIVLNVTERHEDGRVKNYERPTKQDIFDHKLAALTKRQGAKEFAVARQLEEYSRVAEGMTVEGEAADPVHRAPDGHVVFPFESNQEEIF